VENGQRPIISTPACRVENGLKPLFLPQLVGWKTVKNPFFYPSKLWQANFNRFILIITCQRLSGGKWSKTHFSTPACRVENGQKPIFSIPSSFGKLISIDFF